MTMFTIRHVFKYRDSQREFTIPYVYLKCDTYHMATRVAMAIDDAPKGAIRIEVVTSGWFDRFLVWLRILPCVDAFEKDQL